MLLNMKSAMCKNNRLFEKWPELVQEVMKDFQLGWARLGSAGLGSWSFSLQLEIGKRAEIFIFKIFFFIYVAKSPFVLHKFI